MCCWLTTFTSQLTKLNSIFFKMYLYFFINQGGILKKTQNIMYKLERAGCQLILIYCIRRGKLDNERKVGNAGILAALVGDTCIQCSNVLNLNQLSCYMLML